MTWKKIFSILTILLLMGCTQTKTRQGSIPLDKIKIAPETDLMPPIMHSNEFQKPVPFDPVNTAGLEDSPFISKDGQKFFFFFTPDIDVQVEKQLVDGITGIWWTRKINHEWKEPERVVLSDSTSLDGCPFYSKNELWFCSVRQSNYKEIDIWIADYENGWKNWRNAGIELNRDIGAGEFHLNNEKNKIYFHTKDYDLVFSRKINGSWQTPERIDVLNTDAVEGWPYVNQEENELWFTRTYEGSPSIWKSKKINGSWQEPKLIVSQFAGEPSLDNKGNLYFVHHFVDSGERIIESDIYFAKNN